MTPDGEGGATVSVHDAEEARRRWPTMVRGMKKADGFQGYVRRRAAEDEVVRKAEDLIANLDDIHDINMNISELRVAVMRLRRLRKP